MADNIPELEMVGGGPLQGIPTDEMLDAAETALGFKLPPSYRAFAKKYGNGLTEGLFMIYVPVDTTGASWHNDLAAYSSDFVREIRESVEGGYMNFDPDGSRELALRLIPFAGSENGNILAWDPKAPSDDAGEFWIYVIGSRKSYMIKSATSLVDLLERAIQPNTGGILRNAQFSLEPSFEPRPAKG
jgi:hypothetical protein